MNEITEKRKPGRPPHATDKKVKISIALSGTLSTYLTAFAKESEKSASAVVESAIKMYFGI